MKRLVVRGVARPSALCSPTHAEMAVREIFLLGNPVLYDFCAPVERGDVDSLRPIVRDLHDTLMDFQNTYGTGRAIAAPQIGVKIRLIYMRILSPVVYINPVLDAFSDETFELWDDCMSFPDLFVRVRRHRRCRIAYRDLDWEENVVDLEDDLAELLQHECDHLDGILAMSRAVDGRSFALRSEQQFLTGNPQFTLS